MVLKRLYSKFSTVFEWGKAYDILSINIEYGSPDLKIPCALIKSQTRWISFSKNKNRLLNSYKKKSWLKKFSISFGVLKNPSVIKSLYVSALIFERVTY